MISPSTVFSRTRFLVFLCVSLLGLSSTSLLCLALEAFPTPFHDPRRLACRVFLRSHHRSLVCFFVRILFVYVLLVPLWDLLHHLLSSTSASVESSTTALRFSSDQLFSASRRTLRAYTSPSSVRTKCSSARSLFPNHTPDFHLSANIRCWISRSLSDLWKMCKNCFSKLHQVSTIRSAHGTLECGLYLTTSETKDEPRCMSDNPSHQCVVCRWSVLCVCVLALLPTLFALVPATVSDSFRLLHCFDVTLWENFERLFFLCVWI